MNPSQSDKGAPKTPLNKKNIKKEGDPEKRRMLAFLIIPLFFIVILQLFVMPNFESKSMPYSQFYQMASQNLKTGEIVSAKLLEGIVQGQLRSGAYFQVNIPMNDPELIPMMRQN